MLSDFHNFTHYHCTYTGGSLESNTASTPVEIKAMNSQESP